MTEEKSGAWFLALSGGVELVVSVLGLSWLGWWADRKFNSYPWFLVCGTFLGMAVGIYGIIRSSSKKNVP
jgi:F0F1-type ATP synthase assembly protein I